MFENDFARWVKTDLFGGKGDVSVSDLLGRRQAKPFEAVLGCELSPGGSVGAHHQTEAHEIVVCVEGRGRVTVDDEAAELGSGGMVFVRLGQLLSIQNLSDDAPLRYLIIKAK